MNALTGLKSKFDFPKCERNIFSCLYTKYYTFSDATLFDLGNLTHILFVEKLCSDPTALIMSTCKTITSSNFTFIVLNLYLKDRL